MVNRRALEALIHAGAFDAIEPNRNQLIHDLDFVLDWAQSRARDRASGQGNLFDLFSEAASPAAPAPASYESAPKAPPVADFPKQEKLRLEKEILGFYISDHPLKGVQQTARILDPVNLSDLESLAEGSSICAIALITSLKPVITKKGDRMAIIQLEDLTGHTEAVVFPKSYERIGHHIEADARLMVWGKVDRRDEQTQFIVEDAEPIDAVQMVFVELEPKEAKDIEHQHRLRTVLLENQGDKDKAKTPVVAVISNQRERKFVPIPRQFQVQDCQAAVNALVRAGFQARFSSLTNP
jgi:DNA polymerase-3 subunit alpha